VTDDAGPHGGRVEPDEAFHAAEVLSLVTGHAVHDSYPAYLAPLLPRFVDTFGLTGASAGALAAFLQLPSLIQPFVGYLADRRALRWIVILGPAVTGTAMSFLGWAPNYLALALMLVVAGTSVASFHATAPVATGYLSGRRLGRGMGLWMVGGELGRTLGPILVAGALTVLSMRELGFLAVLGIATSGFLALRLRAVVLRTKEGAEQPPWGPALRGMLGLMGLLGGLVALRSLMISASTVFLPLYLTEHGASLFVAGAAVSILEGAGIVGAFLGGWVSDHLGRRAVLLFGHAVAPVALLGFLVTDGGLRLVLLVIVGMSLLAIPPVMMAVVQERSAQSRALANGVYLSMSFAIRSAAAIVFGAVADAVGLTAAMVVAALAMAAGLPLAWRIGAPRSPAATGG